MVPDTVVLAVELEDALDADEEVDEDADDCAEIRGNKQRTSEMTNKIRIKLGAMEGLGLSVRRCGGRY
jgi:hypothetical protein